jgi:hypothetical protein
MMTAAKRQARAAEYHDLAQKSAALAAASPLDRVREKHEAAALRWSLLATMDESPRTLANASPPVEGL